MRKTLPALAALLATALTLTACGSSDTETTDSTTEVAESTTATEVSQVVVGASPVPHAQILEYIQENLAEEAGIEIEIVEFDDYVLPNEALASGEIDANYFQHVPYLEEQISERGYEFEHGEGVHIEPLAAFSNQHDSAEDVPDGATIAITNDPSNQYRGLVVLENAGLLNGITEESTAINLTDEQNPKGLVFEESQPEVVVQLLDDPEVDVAIINANFILSAGLSTENAIAVEAVEDNPYANVLVWRTDNENAGVEKLDELLHSEDVANFIKETWPSGDVIPG